MINVCHFCQFFKKDKSEQMCKFTSNQRIAHWKKKREREIIFFTYQIGQNHK